jgi:hypothetical protein
MSRGFISYTLPASGRTEFVAYSGFLTYRLSDGSELSVDQQPAWCPSCRTFVLGELVPSIEDILRSMEEVRSGDPKRMLLLKMIERSVADELAELSSREEWRRSRRSPPRCLECGCDQIVPLPGSKEFPHPATGEPVIETSSGFASMERWAATFTPEGERIP